MVEEKWDKWGTGSLTGETEPKILGHGAGIVSIVLNSLCLISF